MNLVQSNTPHIAQTQHRQKRQTTFNFADKKSADQKKCVWLPRLLLPPITFVLCVNLVFIVFVNATEHMK